MAGMPRPDRWLGLRARVTLLVTVSAAVVITALSVAALERLEQGLVDDTRASAEQVLAGYLDDLVGGVAGVGVVDEASTTRFYYRDGEGNHLTEREYFEAISEASGAVPSQAPLGEVPAGEVPAGEVPVGEVPVGEVPGGEVPGGGVAPGEVGSDGQGPPGAEPLPADQAAIVGVAPSGGVDLLPIAIPAPVGGPTSVDRGPSIVAIEQALAFPDGSVYSVGVSSPLAPVSDSIDAVARLLYTAVPTLVLGIAAITWLAANRALRHVHAISSRARAISATSLDQRVPLPPARDEIHELAGTVNHMLERIQRSTVQQRQLVADAAHELRSPVAASRVQLEVALANPAGVDWERTASTVLDEQRQLGVLIDDLLALARMAEAGPTLEADLDLDEIVLAEGRRPRARPVAISIDRPARLTGDPALLTRAVRNLVDNAVRHADSRVEVHLEGGVLDQGAAAVVHVDDDGAGVPPDQREAVFDRFTRLDEARTRHEGGSGLGLAIAKEVAVSHGGTLVCTEAPLGGARFTLTVPIV